MQGNMQNRVVALRKERPAEEIARNVLRDAESMGLVPEVREIIDALEECKEKLARKANELSVLEAIAMESEDENIKELREQLFAVVKMVHSDLLTETMEEYDFREQDNTKRPGSGSGGALAGGQSIFPVDKDVVREISKYDILERMRRYLNRRAEYKAFMKAKNY